MTVASLPTVRRRDDLAIDGAHLPRWWLHDNAVLTHFANGLNLIFPEGERFFIRSVSRHLDQLQDPELKARAKAFFGQEGEHGRQHARVIEVLREQGYDVDTFLDSYLPFFRKVERWLPAKSCLAITAALEHLTAALGASALEEPDFLDGAVPVMRDLWRWHAAEEIEHKAVAFDVARAVGVGWLQRQLAMFFALAALLWFEQKALKLLLAQDELSDEARRAHRKEALRIRGGHQRRIFTAAFGSWLRPGFHPDQIDDRHLAEAVFAG